MYDLLCEYFSPDAVNLCFSLLLLVPLAFWWIAVRREGEKFEGYWKYHCRVLGKAGASFGVMFILFLGYAEQKYAQQQAQQQAVIELFTSVSEALGSLSETLLRNWLTPEEKKSRLLPVGLATNATAWVAESQCVTSQVREAWQRVPIRRAAFRQTLPFPVSIAGNSYNEVFISSSGVIGFDAPKGSEITREMPYEEAADHVYLALLWGRIDFKPRLGSKMWCGVKEDGNFVASYDTVFIDGDTNSVAKVQVEFIANGDMILRYSDLPPCSTNAHVAGFQNLDGGWTLPFDNIRSNTALYLKSFGPLDLTVQDSDTDGDGISDYYELYPTNSISLTDPCNRDSDGDGLMDGEEVSLYATDPGAFSSDASGTGDLWRVIGGLGPSDAPYTNATPSGSLGILTVTTVLEGGTTNGGAVLRIADQYIPVLFGTTLVSRIAVPRDATNLFILARGANCDDAIAHIIVEASTFTKIRDPSGVFGWSFALSPSCVTASGAIIMPSYTITPELICFHSLTSKVCRISSADPDIYFVTSQAYVREYTPTAPEIQTNSFEIGSVPIQLACMDATLSTRASVTNIPAHLCNPDTGFSDEYPNGNYYSTWCKFENGVHVWADGYGPTNCPCLPVFTNAFECICSGDGRKPCTCAHAVSDPKAMPLNADQTNVLGHAALVVGGTNDLLQVTVPEGTYLPCPLCACARGEPSSASVYRQTSCIEVTPGSLTADGEFSVAGISPSTNFADTVFMYKITDYSSAQAVTSYTRKDYTVIGTSVYPTNPGHSVSNWFIGCNVTNALTLWTGVKLPSDTGDVTLSVTVESGTPMPQLYVYNRTAQSNELLVTQGQLTFTQNLGDWRSTYCDTNGYAQAYLLCASGGVARITHRYETYTGQPYSLSCNAIQRFTVWEVDLDADTDRDGDIDGADDAGEETWTILRGALVHPYVVDLYNTQVVVYTNLSQIAIAFSNSPSGITLRLKAADSETKTWLTFVDAGGTGVGFTSNGLIDLTCWPTNLYAASSEPRKTSQNKPVRFTVDLEALYMGQVIAKDRILLTVAPVILPPECNDAQTVYATRADLAGLIQGLEIIPSVADQWTQDQVKFVKTQHADGVNADLAVTLGHTGTGNLEHSLKHTNRMPYCQWPVDGQGGNMMATPPLGASSPYGKLMLGSKNIQSQSNWVAQGIQPVVTISNDWLLVGHVDEILMWAAPDKVLFADPWIAADLLHGEIAAGRGSNTIWWGTDANAQRDIEILSIVTDNYKIGQIASSLPDSGDPTNIVFSAPVFEAGDCLRVDGEILALQAVSENGLTGTVARAQADRPAAAHTNGSVIYAYSAVMRKNLIGIENISFLIGLATNQLKQAIGNYQTDFVPVPVLFDGPVSGEYAAQTANMVNCLVLNAQSAYYSDPGNAVFRNYFESFVPGASAIDIWYNYHCGFGEIHCGTAVKRVLSAQPSWWEQNVQSEQWEDMQ